MKAVVLEVRDGYAAVLREDGTVEKLRRQCAVGETIELEDERKVVRLPRRAARWAAGAAAAVILVSGGAYGYNNAYAYSYVTLDANPSIEYVLNRRDVVIAVNALNDDADAIAQTLSDTARRASITDALGQTTALLYEEAYLGRDGEDCLIVSVSSRGESRRQALADEIDAYFDAQAEEGLTVYTMEATRDEVDEAGRLGLSAGKYKLIEEIAGGVPTESEARRLGGESVGALMTERGLMPESVQTPASAPPAEARPSGEPPAADGQTPRTGQTQPARDGASAPELPRQEDDAPPDAQGGMPQGGGSPSGEPSD